MDKIKTFWKKLNSRISTPEHILILVGALIFMFAFLIKTKTLMSGYHFLDDHELIRIKHELKDSNLIAVMFHYISHDLITRYRILYWIERVAVTGIIGDNLTLWNIFTAIKGGITAYLLYMFARYMKNNVIVSALFTGIVLLGAQFTPWFRSANQENTGLMMCALALFIIAIQYYTGVFNGKTNIFLCIAVIMCSLIKESFVLFVPAFIMLKLWAEYTTTDKKILDCLKANKVTYIVLSAAFLLSVIAVVFWVGTDKVSYAGFDEHTGLMTYLYGMWFSIVYPLKWYSILMIPATIMLVILMIKADKKDRISNLILVAIGAYILSSQLVIHAKSFMAARYIIPWIIGYGVVYVIVVSRLLDRYKIVKYIYCFIMFVLIGFQAFVGYRDAQSYAYDGQVVNEFFQDIVDNTDEDTYIICAFTAGELSLSSECRLQDSGRANTCTYVYGTDELVSMARLEGTSDTEYSWEQADAALCYAGEITAVATKLGCTEEGSYTVRYHDNYCIVLRNR